MPKATIENPKVFISYAWGTDEYQNKVLSFASSLVGDGIDVILDKWDMTPGNDTYAFMERCVNDASVTNVLMLLDPVYAEKANMHTGGVGAETQIISAKVYKEVEQTKFIPIVFERNEKGEICKPTYLEARFHIDLSNEEHFDEQYQLLIKKLYGIEAYAKPMLGSKPLWIESTGQKSIRKKSIYDDIKSESLMLVRRDMFQNYLESIKLQWFEHIRSMSTTEIDTIAMYDELQEYRNEYLQLLKYEIYVENSEQILASFLENTYNSIREDTSFDSLNLTLLHEIFLYTIAYLFKKKYYDKVGYILTKTYFDLKRMYNNQPAPESFNILYSGSNHTNLDNAINKKDNKTYYSGTAQFWISHINIDVCTKEDLVLADLICHNCSVFGNVISGYWYWFPLTYVYENEYDSSLKKVAVDFYSKERAKKIIKAFGFATLEDFIEKFKKVEADVREGRIEKYRYNAAFRYAPLLCFFLKSEDIGKYK